MKKAIILIVCCVVVSSCAAHRDKLAKCSADENPVRATAYYESQKQPSVRVFEAQEKLAAGADCGAMRPVNQF
ncbi:hypothetical protein [Phyllobacterium zundukense]|uniref:Uncharacterized protein n=1 Tax=Phyllobacterium zundukense TaxID=1867719 RepID=A0A2N9VV74_9HYPH|nr:hypothetical protein [Phyllobacterium zundukense]ATU94059.1 hypothetical protein BLM14_19900 [Phyllobacterium zundukense]PIO43392.1 hypothetical protein B5P45_17915 [Phyllobacterium zundukense]